MAHPNRLANTRILIFGGTSGIGFGVASLALSNGATVIISGSRQPKVDSKVQELASLYPDLPASRVLGYACDLSDIAGIDANIKDILDKATENGTKTLDHIVHTAGDALKLPTLQDVTVENALAGFHVRFLTGVMVGKHLATDPGYYMPVSPTSSLTLTSGTNSEKPRPGWSLGASWGSAVEGLSRGLAVDLKPIRVNVVAPGAIETPLLEKFVQAVGEEKAEEMRREGSLVGRWGSVGDCAEAYAWGMRDWFVTGVRIESNGGRMLMGP
ncbi:NAD(P)-binding protein [Byssothecium circinans]|uniref:NAD(P)-binding protein n=1 Tax=Byssothecium circinans TaxID=147558 RepID=A0A6A5U3Z2_9PLEO|nr:NAD(P)-binding protein [Byssothecium circinans]